MGMIPSEPEPDPDYKAYFNEVRREISSPQYFGRNYYADGDVRAAMYIIDKARRIKDLEPHGRDSKGDAVAVTESRCELQPGDYGRHRSYKGFSRRKPYLQNFTHPHNAIDGDLALTVDGRPLAPLTDFAPKSTTCAARGTFPLVEFPKDKYTSREAFTECLESGLFEGAFALIDNSLLGKIPGGARQFYWDAFRRLDPGKVAGLLISQKYVRFGSFPSGFETSVPVLCVRESALGENPRSIEVAVDAHLIDRLDSHNIAAYLPGTDSGAGDIALIAHYDHHGIVGRDNVFCGANDNASSCAMLLALAKYFSLHRPACGIQLIWVDKEESDLLGSAYYSENPCMDLGRIRFLINLEQTADNGNSLWCGGNAEGKEELDRILTLNDENAPYEPFKVTRIGFGSNSDHYSFGLKGVPVCYLATVGDSNNLYYHTPQDTFANTWDDNFDRLFRLIVRYVEEHD